MNDQDLNDELVAHAQGRPLLDRVFPPELCDLGFADRHARVHLQRVVPDETWNGRVSA